jgi:hypothetical protein
VRVRSVQVHDAPAQRAAAGQRVALNLAGVAVRDVAHGDVIAAPGALVPTRVLDCHLHLRDARHGMRAHVHHGTREAPARLADLGDGLWQARLERPLLARAGDRVVVRSIAPPDTLGGGIVLDAAARRHGRRPEVLARLQRLRRGEPDLPPPPAPPAPAPAAQPRPAATLSRAALDLEERLRAAGHEPPSEAALDPANLRVLRDAGRAVRVGRAMYAHPDALAAVRARVEADTRRRSWSTSTPNASPSAFPTTRACSGGGRGLGRPRAPSTAVPTVTQVPAKTLCPPYRLALLDASSDPSECRQLARLVCADRECHAALGDPRDFRRVDEPLARGRVEDDPVEDVLAHVLERAAHGPDLDALGRAHRGAAWQDLVGDRVAVVGHDREGCHASIRCRR